MQKWLFIGLFLCVNIGLSQVSDFSYIDFTKADNIAKQYQGHTLTNLGILAYKLTNQLHSDAEKFRAIYLWVCQNIKGDYSQDKKVIFRRKKFKNDSLEFINWNSNYKEKSLKRLIKNKKAVCTGYAYLIKQLCVYAGIKCKLINGYGRTFVNNIETLEFVNHTWNAVKLNDKWYLCDATWASGYFNEKNKFIQHYIDGYFLTEPTFFAQNHYPIDQQWFLTNSFLNNSFSPSAILYRETYKYMVKPIFPKHFKTLISKGDTLFFSFKSPKTNVNSKIALVYFVNNKAYSFKLINLKTYNTITSFSARFNTKGTFDVHLKIDNAIVASYVVKVKKR